MQPKNVFGGLVLLLLGGALGYGLAPKSDGTQELATSNPASTSVNAAERLVGDDATSDRTSLEGVQANPYTPSPERLAQVMDAVVVPDVGALEEGEDAVPITGSVRYENGDPVAGAVIVCTRVLPSSASVRRNDRWQGAPAPRSLEKDFERTATYWARARSGEERIDSDEAGEFRTRPYADGAKFIVRAYLDAHEIVAAEGGYVRPGDTVNFVARRVARIAIEVTHADGRDVTEAVIGIREDDRYEFHAWTKDEPWISVLPGSYSLRAFDGLRDGNDQQGAPDADGSSPLVTVQATLEEQAPIPLELRSTLGIRGSLKGNRDRLLQVRMLSLGATGDVDEELLATSMEQASLRDRRFRFMDLSPGRYAVGVVVAGKEVLCHEVITIEDHVVEVVLTVPESRNDDALVITVLDTTGAGIPGVQFDCLVRKGNYTQPVRLRPSVASNGTYTLHGSGDFARFFLEWDPAESFLVTLQHPSYADLDLQLVEGQREATVQLMDPVTVRVEVEGHAASPFRGRLSAAISIPRKNGSATTHRDVSDAIDADGVGHLTGLEPGTYQVELRCESDRVQFAIAAQTVDATSGEVLVRFQMPKLHTLRVRAPGFAVGTVFYLHSDALVNGHNARYAQATLDEDGIGIFRDLGDGGYQLSTRDAQGNMAIEIPSAEVVFEGEVLDCLTVRIDDEDGLLAASGLIEGDVIVGWDGQEQPLARTIEEHLEAHPGQQVQLLVLRDGSAMTVPFTCPAVSDNEVLGGSLKWDSTD